MENAVISSPSLSAQVAAPSLAISPEIPRFTWFFLAFSAGRIRTMSVVRFFSRLFGLMALGVALMWMSQAFASVVHYVEFLMRLYCYFG